MRAIARRVRAVGFFFSSRRRHTRSDRDWSSDVCSSDLSGAMYSMVPTPGGSRCNSTGVGTIEYMAPEVIKGSDISAVGPGYGKACDWWSLEIGRASCRERV